MDSRLFQSHVLIAEKVMGPGNRIDMIGQSRDFLVAILRAHNTAGQMLIASSDPEDAGIAAFRVGLRAVEEGFQVYKAGEVTARHNSLDETTMERLGALGLFVDGQPVIAEVNTAFRWASLLDEPVVPLPEPAVVTK